MPKVNQCATILNHLMYYRSITADVARERYGITALAARILELRKLGFHIRTRKGSYVIPQGHRRKPREKVTELELFDDYGT